MSIQHHLGGADSNAVAVVIDFCWAKAQDVPHVRNVLPFRPRCVLLERDVGVGGGGAEPQWRSHRRRRRREENRARR